MNHRKKNGRTVDPVVGVGGVSGCRHDAWLAAVHTSDALEITVQPAIHTEDIISFSAHGHYREPLHHSYAVWRWEETMEWRLEGTAEHLVVPRRTPVR